MPFDALRFKVFSRRVFIVSGLKILVLFLILMRLFKFQILDYKYFKSKSDGNRIKSIIIPPLRGVITDRNGVDVATNTIYYRIILKKRKYREDVKAIQDLASILGFKQEGLNALMSEYRRNRNQSDIVLYRYLTRPQLMRVEYNLYRLPYVSIGVGDVRHYENSFSLSHMLGYVVQVSASVEVKNSDKKALHPDIKVGEGGGLESYYNSTLTGKAGAKYVEVNAAGFKIDDLEVIAPTQGRDIKLSFDSKIQNFAYELCKTQKAAVVLLNIETGEVLCMVSTPSFDINELSKKITTDSWNELLNDPKKPLINRAISAAHAPGSIFKLVTALAALENGHNPAVKYRCTGTVNILKMLKHCWLKNGHGWLDLHGAIKHSCNITFYELALETPMSEFERVARELSFGQNFENFEFRRQNRGTLPNDAWKREVLKEPWYPGDTVNLSIGQGYLRANALQLAVMMARLASGKKVEPHFNFISSESEAPFFAELSIKKQNLEYVKKGLYDATNTSGGTSYYSRITEKGMEYSGKTGTAQVVSKFLEKHEYNDTNRPHALFAGFAPFERPKFAVSVVVENGGFGSSASAPIGKNILYYAQLLNAGRFGDAEKFMNSVLKR